MKTAIDTQISDVIVYTDRARVTRLGSITLTGSETQLRVDRLPIQLDPASIRVGGAGSSPVKILAVNTERQRFTQPVGDQLAAVTREIETIEAQIRQIQAQIATAQMQSEFLMGLRLKTQETFPSSLARQRLTLEDTLSFIDQIGNKFTEYALLVENYQQQCRELEKQLAVLRSRHQNLSHPQSTESYQVAINIEASAGEFQLELTYNIQGASWNPLYDLRVNTSTQQLQLTYLAEIHQRTGEDWPEVGLTLSTAQPNLGNIPPQLNPWYVDLPTPVMPMVMPMTRQRSEAVIEQVAPTLLTTKASAPSAPMAPAEVAMATAERQGNVVTFRLQGSGSVPNGGSPYKATISQGGHPCKLSYVLMPKLVDFAYLQAMVQNPADGVTLLAGQANIFRNEQFVGQISLMRVAPGQEFDLNLGIDEGIVVERELIERQVDKKFLGSNRRIFCAYRLQLQNLQTTTATLKLAEQIPHSRSEKIKIKLLKSEPLISLGELGRLEWQLSLAAGQKCHVSYQFAIEYPEDTTIQGFDI